MVYFTALFVLQACSEYFLPPGWGALKMQACGQAAVRVTKGKGGVCCKGEVFPGENPAVRCGLTSLQIHLLCSVVDKCEDFFFLSRMYPH